MNNSVITTVEELTPARLTKILRQSSAKLNGQVSAIKLIPQSGTTSKIAKLAITYTEGSTGDLPATLLLKICQSLEFGNNASEVNYYAKDYLDLEKVAIPHCYHAVYSGEKRAYHLLLEDLTATHTNNWEITPSLKYGQAVAQALAKMHAHWWGSDRLNQYGTTIPTAGNIQTYLDNVQPGLDPMLEATKTDITAQWQADLREIFAKHPAKMAERLKNPSGFTVVHGDVNPGNVLSHRENTTPIYIIDRQPFSWSLTTWLGVSDLAYMMVHWWDTEIRRNLEFEVLRTYHHTLLENGVKDYTWEQLMYDYKLCAIQSLYVAANWCISDEERKQMRWVWYPQLLKAVTAFYELNCLEIL